MLESKKVLLVEDNFLAAKYISFLLQSISIDSVIASNIKTALDFLSKDNYDIIITDLHLVNENGLDLIHQISSKNSLKHIPVIVMSSDNRADGISKVISAGAVDFISKPIQENVFYSKINAILKNQDTVIESLQNKVISFWKFKLPIIVNCTNTILNFKNFLDIHQLSVFSKDDFIKHVCIDNDYIFIVDKNSDWLLKEVDFYRKKTFLNQYPIIYLGDLEPKCYDANICVLHVKTSAENVVSLVEFYINTIAFQNSKTIELIQKATEHSSFIFPKTFKKVSGSLEMQVFHQNFNLMNGGDFYETFTFNETVTVTVVGDIMGKSWNAWFYLPAYLAYIRTTIKFMLGRNLKRIIYSPEKILTMINGYLSKDLQMSQVFSTLQIIVSNSETNTCVVSGAGAINPMYYSFKNKTFSQIDSSGPVLGLDSNSEFYSKTIVLENGDYLFVISDGYTEILNNNKKSTLSFDQLTGYFTAFIKENSDLTKFDEGFMSYFNIALFDDDRTILMLRSLGN